MSSSKYNPKPLSWSWNPDSRSKHHLTDKASHFAFEMTLITIQNPSITFGSNVQRGKNETWVTTSTANRTAINKQNRTQPNCHPTGQRAVVNNGKFLFLSSKAKYTDKQSSKVHGNQKKKWSKSEEFCSTAFVEGKQKSHKTDQFAFLRQTKTPVCGTETVAASEKWQRAMIYDSVSSRSVWSPEQIITVRFNMPLIYSVNVVINYCFFFYLFSRQHHLTRTQPVSLVEKLQPCVWCNQN